MADQILSLHHVTKSFGPVRALHDLSVEFQPGTVTLLLGANGAGKSSLLRICAGLSRADKGKVKYGIENGVRVPFASIGYSGHDHLMYEKLTVREQFELIRGLHGGEVTLEKSLKEWDLEEYADALIETLSKGTQARASLCRALLFGPKIIVLDEPSSALDESSVDTLARQISSAVQEQKALAVIATHDISRLKKVAHRVIVMHHGGIQCDSEEFDGELAERREKVLLEYQRLNR